MYWSAITTRLLVGMLTPAIRATSYNLLTRAKARKSGPALRKLRMEPIRLSRPFAEGACYRYEIPPVNAGGRKMDRVFKRDRTSSARVRALRHGRRMMVVLIGRPRLPSGP